MTAAEIARLIPHSGPMCLLDGVLSWDATRIQCVGRGHRDPQNPMRAGGRLPALCGVEYAMQAMAAHGGLTGKVEGRPRRGYLASLRDVECRRERMDDLAGDLTIDAEMLAGDGAQVSYRFSVKVGATELLSGRALVVLDAGRDE